MAMFKKQIRFTGKHAYIMQKYSKDKGGDQEIKFNVNNNSGVLKDIYIFETRIYIYLVAGMIGIIMNRQADVDKSSQITSTIMVDMLEKQRESLERMYHHMVLVEKSSKNADERIKNAFSVNKDDKKNEFEQIKLENYVRGGLEIIDEIFKDCKTYEDVCNGIYELSKKLNAEVFLDMD